MTVALVDNRISEASEQGLLKRGFKVLKMPPAEEISAPMASHPDMLVAKLGNNLITTASYIDKAPYIFSDIREYAPHIKIHVTGECQEEKYPKDAILNVLVMGNKIFARCESLSRKVIELAGELDYELVNTRQGYPACTTLALGENEAITADAGLAGTLSKNGITVTLIKNGGITLPPYEYGFIGGATGVFGKEVFFIGNPKSHASYNEIEQKIKSLVMNPVSLSEEPLSDMGKIIFL